MHIAETIFTLAALATPLATGWLIVAIACGTNRMAAFPEKIALGWIAGWTVIGVEMFIAGLARIPFTAATIVAPAVAQLLILTLVARKMGLLYPVDPPVTPARTGGTARILATILAGVVILQLASVVWMTVIRPIQAWDSLVNLSAAAKMFYYSGNLWLDSPDHFFGRGMLLRNTNYPPQNQLMQVWMALWIGRFDECLVKLWAPGYLASIAILSYWGMRRASMPPHAALGAVAILLSSPLLRLHATESYSDVPLAAAILASIIFLWRMTQGEIRLAPLLGLSLASCMLMKDEGTFFAVLCGVSAAMVLATRADSGRTGMSRIIGLAAPLLITFPWFAFKCVHGLGWGADHVTPGLAWHPENIARFFRSLVLLRNFNVVIPVFAVMFVFALFSRRRFLYVYLPVVLYASVFLAVYIFSAFLSQEIMFGSSFYRTVLGWYPSALFLAVLMIHNVWSTAQRPP